MTKKHHLSTSEGNEKLHLHTRLSLSACRQLLKLPQLSDDEVEKIRDSLYSFADLLTDRYIKEHPKISTINSDDNVQ